MIVSLKMSWCVARKASSPGLLLAESTALPTLRELTKHKTENTQHTISLLVSKSIQENAVKYELVWYICTPKKFIFYRYILQS